MQADRKPPTMDDELRKALEPCEKHVWRSRFAAAPYCANCRLIMGTRETYPDPFEEAKAIASAPRRPGVGVEEIARILRGEKGVRPVDPKANYRTLPVAVCDEAAALLPTGGLVGSSGEGEPRLSLADFRRHRKTALGDSFSDKASAAIAEMILKAAGEIADAELDDNSPESIAETATVHILWRVSHELGLPPQSPDQTQPGDPT